MNLVENGNFNSWPLGTAFAIDAGASNTVLLTDWEYKADGASQPAVNITREAFTFGDTLAEGAPHYFLQVEPETAPTAGSLLAAYLQYNVRRDLTLVNRAATLTFYANTTVEHEIVIRVLRRFIGGTGPVGDAEVVVNTTSFQLRAGWRKYRVNLRFPTFTGATHDVVDDVTSIRFYFQGDEYNLGSQAIPWKAAIVKFSQISLVPYGVEDFETESLPSSDNSVLERFGIVGNGVVDDTDALQAWIDSGSKATNYNKSHTMRRYMLPEPPEGGFFLISAPLVIRSSTSNSVILEGETSGVMIKNITDGQDVLQINPVEAGESLSDPDVYGRILYKPTIRNLTLRGTGATSRAIYAQQTDHLVVENVDCIQHPGPSLWMESAPFVAGLTNYGFSGCFFSRIQILTQPEAAIVCITSIGGRSNRFEGIRCFQGEVGVDLIDEDAAVFMEPYAELMTYGTAKTFIRARGYSGPVASGFMASKRTIMVVGGVYTENVGNYFIDADAHYTVNMSGGTFVGGTGDKIKCDGGGRLFGVNGQAGIQLESAGVLEVEECHNVFGDADHIRSSGVTLPIACFGENRATKSWFDTEPTWAGGGASAPTFTFNTGSGFYGSNSKSATFPTGGDLGTSVVILSNTSVSMVAGDHVSAIVAVKFDRADQLMVFRMNTETVTTIKSKTTWQIVFLSYKGTLTSSVVRLMPYSALASPITATIGALAVAKNNRPILINTETYDRPQNSVQSSRIDLGSQVQLDRDGLFGVSRVATDGLFFDGSGKSTTSLGTQVLGTGGRGIRVIFSNAYCRPNF